MTSFKLTSSVTILAFACASACASPAAHAAPPQSAMGHGGARSAATNVEASNKAIIKELSLALLGGADLQALGRYFAPNLIAHDPVMSNGRGGMLVAIDALRRSLPGHTLTIKHILADRDQVLVHSHISSTPANEKSGLNRIDIYRLDRGIVVEHWDVRNAAPTSSASGNSAFSDLYQYAGPKPVLSDERVEGNRLLVKHVSEEVFGKQNFALLDRLFGVNYIQHNPYVGNGRAALASVIQ